MARSATLPCFAAFLGGFATPFNQLAKIYLRWARLEDMPAAFDSSVFSHFQHTLYQALFSLPALRELLAHPRRNQHFSLEALGRPAPAEANVAFISSARQTKITFMAFLFPPSRTAALGNRHTN